MNYKDNILNKLLYTPSLRFSDLQIDGLTSKHFNYYLKQLVEEGLITKKDKFYYLTDLGKEYIGRLNEENMILEKQPKLSVAVIVERDTPEGKEYLLNKRLKQPYYGKVGGFTGKIRFGETLEEAARRELLEETGLTGDFHFSKILRKMAYTETDQGKQIVQDQFMAFFLVTNPQGELIAERKENSNFWYKYSEIPKRTDLYNTFSDFLQFTINTRSKPLEIFVEAEGF